MSNGGQFGNMLAQFPELIKSYDYFDAPALHGSGYGPSTEVAKTRGRFQCTGGRMMKNENGNLVYTKTGRYWTTDTLQAGRFFYDGIDVYRIAMPDNEWKVEGGFTVYDLAKVVGNDGKETAKPVFDQGTGSLV